MSFWPSAILLAVGAMFRVGAVVVVAPTIALLARTEAPNAAIPLATRPVHCQKA